MDSSFMKNYIAEFCFQLVRQNVEMYLFQEVGTRTHTTLIFTKFYVLISLESKYILMFQEY